MAFQYEAPENLDNEAPFLKDEGVFHLAVTHAEEDATFKRGNLKGQLRGGFALELEVLAGPHAKKTVEVFGRNPSPSHKDQGVFCRLLQGRILEAIGVTNPSDRGKTVTIELVKASGVVAVLGRQCIVKFSKNEDGYIDLDGANIWHVDDPAAEKCEFNQAALKMIPTSLRRKPESFAKPDAKASGSGNGSSSGSGSASGGTKAPIGAGVDLDNL